MIASVYTNTLVRVIQHPGDILNTPKLASNDAGLKRWGGFQCLVNSHKLAMREAHQNADKIAFHDVRRLQ
jgi:hypothetical protein